MKRSGPLRRRTPLAWRSAKRLAITDERREFVERILRTRRLCEFRIDEQAPTCQRQSAEVHEILSRARGGPIVPSQGLTDNGVVALCHEHHAWITTHPAAATRLGYLTSKEHPDHA